MDYPFVPKSTRSLIPGQFWAVPLSNGTFACGRILQLNTEEIPSKTGGFFGGLHDWTDREPPTADAIAGRDFLAYGVMHIKAITETGGMILGHRSLEVDGIRMPIFASAGGGGGTMILDGSQHLRIAAREEWGKYPTLGFWGYNFITDVAERHFVDNANVG